jgi:hypothetical protein
MQKSTPAESPDAYVAALHGWQRETVAFLRSHTVRAAALTETVKWGHLVYSMNGPVLLIRAEAARVLFGFWRGSRLRDLEPRLKPGGKYEMATLELREGEAISAVAVRKLVREATELNLTLGDPTALAKRASSAQRARDSRRTPRPH